jgi:hypothetical protein
MNTKCNVSAEFLRWLPDNSCGPTNLNVLSGVGEADWAFKTAFVLDRLAIGAPNTDLVFEGLDTYATVLLVSIFLALSSALLASTDPVL